MHGVLVGSPREAKCYDSCLNAARIWARRDRPLSNGCGSRLSIAFHRNVMSEETNCEITRPCYAVRDKSRDRCPGAAACAGGEAAGVLGTKL